MTTWLKDKKGNKCSVEYFGSEEAAKIALDSLIDCKNCTNCSDCSDCSRCSDCSYCSDCSDCSRCSYCSDCSRCSRCSRCTKECVIGPRRSDGYTFFLTPDGHIHAGCRDFASFAAARKHWRDTRGGTALGIESQGILLILQKLAKVKK